MEIDLLAVLRNARYALATRRLDCHDRQRWARHVGASHHSGHCRARGAGRVAGVVVGANLRSFDGLDW